MNISEAKLSIIIPIYNEEKSLPLLLSDLNAWNVSTEIIIVKSYFSDNTELISQLSNAKIFNSIEPNRGRQMKIGADNSTQEWLLFIHADSRLEKGCWGKVDSVIRKKISKRYAWYFDLKIDGKNFNFRLLELIVFFRSVFLNKPYGDQGLLINKELYKKIGGFKPFYIMEDLDIITRILRLSKLKRLKIPLLTSGRKWEKRNILLQSLVNANLRRRWRKGESTYNLYKEYYSKQPKITFEKKRIFSLLKLFN